MEMETFTPETTEQRTVRRPRTADNRDSDNRSANQRAPITFARGSRFNLPQSVLNDTRYEFSFIEYTVANEEDYSRCDNATGNHWKPVVTTEYPDLERNSAMSLRKREDGDKVYGTGGQKLFKREVEICEAEKEYFAAKNQTSDELVAAHRDENPMGHFFMNKIGAAHQRGGRL